MKEHKVQFGTLPVFFTAISTILGAILFLRFGFAVGTLGFWGVALIVLLGHMITIPTALAISEIATNKRVEGGGEYFIISRSFGLNIGATIGIALYLSQSISIAFYVIAFTEAFQFVFEHVRAVYGLDLPRQAISVPAMLLLSSLILYKGANLGIKALYGVVGILAVSIVLFFLGQTGFSELGEFSMAQTEMRNPQDFFLVFAIIFPAFTGMTAGVGLSGDLKDPGKSIPLGTISATLIGMVIYLFIASKLALSATAADLVGDQFIMGKIALYGAIVIPLGLAASTISSALGSVMVAPRTLHALASDNSFPLPRINRWLSRLRKKDSEPFNASLITCALAMLFVVLGDVNAVAQIISMFFMITYGSLCLISVLNHFGTSPSYRPTFRSKWYISLVGFAFSVWVMFKINLAYTVVAVILMTALYIYVNNYHRERKGLSSIFANSIFQLNRNLQLYLQKFKFGRSNSEWRPSAICISADSFERDSAFQLLSWISHKYCFGTYLHKIEGYYSSQTFERSQRELKQLISNYGQDSHVYMDTIISPSYTSAVAQSIQISGISGMDNNMVIFEYDKDEPSGLQNIIDNFKLVRSGHFDVCIYASSRKPIVHRNGIHVWIKPTDDENANLMIILSFIILGHPDWANGNISIFAICREEEKDSIRQQMETLMETGRLPVTTQNIQIIVQDEARSYKDIMLERSAQAGLTVVGFREENLKHRDDELFEGFEGMGHMVFVHSFERKLLD